MVKENGIRSLVILGACCFAGPVVAQDVQREDAQTQEGLVLEEITITASRREETLQEASVSVSAVSGDFLRTIGAQSFNDYLAFVPSVNAASNTAGERGGMNILIRGVSNTRIALGDASLLTATSGFYLNDIPITAVDTQLFDIDRVEILRGPQGTLYGAAAQGGAVRLFLNKPNLSEFEAAVEGTVGFVKGGPEFGTALDAMIDIPIFEGVFGVRLVGGRREQDGFIDNIKVPLTNLSGQVPAPVNSQISVFPVQASERIARGANKLTTTGGSLSARYTPNDRFAIDFTQIWQLAENGDLNFVDNRFNGAFLQEAYMLQPNRSDTYASALTVTYDTDWFKIVSNSGLYERKYEENIDFTRPIFTGDGFSSVLTVIPAVVALTTQTFVNTFTQEIRFESDRSGFSNPILSRLDWVFGFFYMDGDRRFLQITEGPGWAAAAPMNPLALPGDVRSISDTDFKESSEAVFLDLTFNVTERFAISAGARYFDLATQAVQRGLGPQNRTVIDVTQRAAAEDGISPRFGASYDFNDATKFYTNYGEGFRLGGADTPLTLLNAPLCIPVLQQFGLTAFASGNFESDDVSTVEIGLKRSFGNGRATLNASAYRTAWEGLQSQIRLGDFSQTCFNVITANVGEAEIDGFELEFAAQATDRLRLQASVAYTDAVIKDPGLSPFKAGDRVLNVPNWSGGLQARYEIPTSALGGGTFFIHGDVSHMGERLPTTGSTNPLLDLDAYTLVGARLGFVFGGDKPTTVTLFGRNLLDDWVELNSRAKIGVSSTVNNMGLRQNFGISLRKEF